MSANTVRVSHGGSSHEYMIANDTCAGDLKTDRELQAALGMGSNVYVVVDGSVVDDNYRLRAGQNITFRTRASSKAAK